MGRLRRVDACWPHRRPLLLAEARGRRLAEPPREAFGFGRAVART
jgi:hypothetical protein